MKKDFTRDFDHRLRNVVFKSKLNVKAWQPSKTIDKVLDYELQHRYKSLEERVLSRVELWIDFSRIETTSDGSLVNNGKKKFYTSKRNKKHDTLKSKFRSLSVGRSKSKSVENLHAHYFKEQTIDIQENQLSPSFSTNDLLDDPTRSPEGQITHSVENFGTMPKRKFRFFFFKKKEFSDYYDGAKTAKKRKSRKSKDTASRTESDASSTKSSEHPATPENNNVKRLHSNSRPSLFAMESLQNHQQSSTEHVDYDPTTRHKRKNMTANKYHTVTITSTKPETLFNKTSGLKDSFRFHNGTSTSRKEDDPQMFYHPSQRQADLGEI